MTLIVYNFQLRMFPQKYLNILFHKHRMCLIDYDSGTKTKTKGDKVNQLKPTEFISVTVRETAIYPITFQISSHAIYFLHK